MDHQEQEKVLRREGYLPTKGKTVRIYVRQIVILNTFETLISLENSLCNSKGRGFVSHIQKTVDIKIKSMQIWRTIRYLEELGNTLN